MRYINQLICKRDYSLTFNADRKSLITATAFCLFFIIFEILSFKTNILETLSLSQREGDFISILIYGFYIVVSTYFLFALVLLTIISGWLYRILCLTIFTFSIFTEYAYQKSLGRFTNYFDLINAISATWDQKIDSVFVFINFWAFLPILVLISICLYLNKSHFLSGGKRFAIILILISGFFLHLSYINKSFFSGNFANLSVGAFFQTITDFLINKPPLQINPPKRQQVETPLISKSQIPTNNIIFVFDESIRADHLSLNGYSRPTTPFLEKLVVKKELLNWGTAVSSSTSSHPSYDAMICGATPEMLQNLSLTELNSLPTIFQYAKSMNYKTYFFDGQMKDYWGGIPDDLNYIDDYVSMRQIDNPDRLEDWQIPGNKITLSEHQNNQIKQSEIDKKIAGLVNQIFSNSPGNFIFVYKRGSHFPYEKNYPVEEAPWKPIYFFKGQYEIPPADNFEAIVNSYDNSIWYNLDRFFLTLSPEYSNLPNNTLIIYTSDHGESFFVSGHAGHGGTSREEAMIPLFLLGNKNKEIDTKFKATHSNIFTTLLDMMNYPEELRKHPYAISLLKAKQSDSARRFYNPQPNQKLPFD